MWKRITSHVSVVSCGFFAGYNSFPTVHAETLRDHEFGVPKDRKRSDPMSPFFPSHKHPCTHAGMFIPGCHELKVFSGSSHFELADDIARRLGTRVGRMTLGRFADGEVQVQIGESVRGKDVYLIQSLCNPVNDNIIELLLMVSTMRRSSAKRVSVVLPYYAYRHHKGTGPKSTSLNSHFLHSPASDIAHMLEVMGVDRAIAVDLQRPGQSQEACFFSAKVPVETLETVMAGVEYFATQVRLKGPLVVLSPNAACLEKARKFSNGLRKWKPTLDTRIAAYVEKGGDGLQKKDNHLKELVGDVKGADVIIVDEMVNDAEAMLRMLDVVKSQGAKNVYCFASHAALDSKALQQIDESELEQLVFMDTIPADPKCTYVSDKVKRLSVAPMLAELIQAEHFKAHSYIDNEKQQVNEEEE